MPALWMQTANYLRRKVVSHKYWCESLCQTQNFQKIRGRHDTEDKTGKFIGSQNQMLNYICNFS
jgi:hypothetical protein